MQNEPAAANDAFTTFYTSSVVKQKVNVNTGFQFPHRVWKAPENPPADTNWRVIVILKWFQRGSSTTVQGKLTASYDYYHVKGGGATHSTDHPADRLLREQLIASTVVKPAVSRVSRPCAQQHKRKSAGGIMHWPTALPDIGREP